MTTVRNEARKRADNLSQIWLGTNLQQKGLQDVLKQIQHSINPEKAKLSEQEEIQANWNRLAAMKFS